MLGQTEIERMNRNVRSGISTEVRATLAELPPNKAPRKILGPLSQLAWRAGLAEWGIRALRPALRVHKDATDGERLEYAACLLRNGLLEEGLEILQAIPIGRHPKTLLYRGFAWMTRWEYGKALEFLRGYLKVTPARSYDAFTAKVNVAACLVFLRDDLRAETLLSSLLHDASVRGHRLLLGNVLHLSAAQFVQSGKVDKARRLLASASTVLGQASALDLLFLDKWKALTTLLAEGPGDNSRHALDQVRVKAAELGHFETLRDCDRHWALAHRDKALFEKLFFGTSYTLFRERLIAEWGTAPLPDSTYVWSQGSKPTKTIEWLVAEGPLKRSQLPFRVLRELTRDFYRPSHPGELFARLFPGEYYDPDVSLHRVHEGVRRLRQTLAKEKVPATIEFENGVYRLSLPPNLGIRVPFPAPSDLQGSPAEAKLRTRYGAKPFSSGPGAKELGLPLRTAQRLYQAMIDQGVLLRTGSGKGTRYQLAKV